MNVVNARIPVGGDIITAIDGNAVSTVQDLTLYLDDQTGVGHWVELTVVWGNEEMAVEVTRGDQPQRSHSRYGRSPAPRDGR